MSSVADGEMCPACSVSPLKCRVGSSYTPERDVSHGFCDLGHWSEFVDLKDGRGALYTGKYGDVQGVGWYRSARAKHNLEALHG